MRSAAVSDDLWLVLGQVKRAVATASGSRARMFLFGSHARGEADADSDVDLLVVLPDEAATHQIDMRVRDAIYEFSLKGHYLLSVLVASESQAEDLAGSMVFADVEREGVPI